MRHSPAFRKAPGIATQALSSAKANDHKKAIEQLKAVALYPNFALAWNRLGIQNMVLARYQEAEEGLRATLKLAPDAISTRLNYGFVLLQQKIYSRGGGFRLVLQKN
jgi:tetratricopeptide (TPR) repeat protein